MSRYFVSVGGTGQHVALALTRLVYMKALRHDIQLVAIDPDNQSPLPKLLEAPAGMKDKRHPLQGGQVFAPFDMAKIGTAPFSKMFVDASHLAEKEFFEALFDADSASIPIHKGMYGTPSVGATVFAEGVHGDALQTLLRPLQNADRVFICGSVVGGTGAGLIHKLVSEIRKHYTKEMYGIFMLPWFRISASEKKGAITQATLDRNASHGVKYFYEHTIPQLNASALIGYPGTKTSTVLRPLTVAEGDMGEHPHFLHLAAAHALVKLPESYTANRGVKAYGIAHDPKAEGWLIDEQWEHNQHPLRRVLRAHRVVCNLLGFLALRRADLVKYYRAGTFKRTFLTRDPWGDDLHASIEANVPPGGQEGTFADDVMAEFEQIHTEIQFCVRWLERLFPDGLADERNDALMDELGQASLAGGQSPFHWKTLCSYWAGERLAPNTTSPNTAVMVARHHAQIVLDAALNMPAPARS